MTPPGKQGEASSGGFRLPMFGKATGLSAIRSRDMNKLIGRLQCLGNIQVAIDPKATENRVVYSDANIIIVLSQQALNDVTVDGVQVKRAVITAIGQDTVSCTLWDEDESGFYGESVDVAKPTALRGSLASESEYGVTWSYSYTGSDYQERTRSATGLAATKQLVFDPYRVGDEIFVVNTNEATGISSVTYIDLNVIGRRWFTETEGCDDEGNPLYAFVARGPWLEDAVGENFA